MHSFSLIDGRNYPSIPSMLKDSSQPNTPVLTPKSSYTINQCATKLEEARTSYSLTTSISVASVRQSYTLMELNTEEEEERTPRKEGANQTKENHQRKTFVKDSTPKAVVDSQKKNATTSIPARDVENLGTERPAQPRNINEPMNGMRPKYLHHNIWDPSPDFSPTTSDWTLTAKPLEGPPQSTLDDEVITKTLSKHPDLFKIVTPIWVDVFETYLSTHPNHPFVKLVCKGLREGFWPWAMTPIPGYPIINNKSKPTPKDEKKAEFLRAQWDIEVTKDRFSPPFKGGLLPGMYCMPIYAVPKPHSSDLCLVTDQSYGKFSLITHNKVTGFPLDNMVHFGEMLIDLEKREPGGEKVAWKSYVAEAYWILPMHPRWQIKQVNRVDDKYHVDRCNSFGGSGSPGIFISFNTLVAWIAKEIKGIHY